MSDQRRPHFLLEGGLLFGAHGMRALVVLALMTVASHLLSVEDFGAFSFLQSLFLWIAILAEAGMAVATARLLSREDVSSTRHVLTAFTYIFGWWSLLVAFLVAAAARPIAVVFQLPVENSLLLCAIPALGIVWLGAMREILPALGRVRTLALIEVLPPLIALLAISVMGAVARSLEAIAITYTLAFLLVTTLAIRQLVHFETPVAAARRQLLEERRRFGQSVYVARLVGTGGFMVDIPVLAFFTADAALVGQYALLKGLAAPIALIGQAIATAQFRTLARDNYLPGSAIIASALGAVICAVGLATLGPMFVSIVFPAPYSAINSLLPIWALTAFLQASYQLPNTYLRARGHGKDLRSLAFLFGGVSTVLHLTLTPTFQLVGASIAALVAVAVWTSGAWLLYRRRRDEHLA